MCAATEKRSPTMPPVGADQKDAISALVDQLHGGFQLRPTALGNFIRGCDSTSDPHSAAQSNGSPIFSRIQQLLISNTVIQIYQIYFLNFFGHLTPSRSRLGISRTQDHSFTL